MSGDRHFYSPEKDSFIFLDEKGMLDPGKTKEFSIRISVPVKGKYFVQCRTDLRFHAEMDHTFFFDPALPVLHNDCAEIPCVLEEGEEDHTIHITNLHRETLEFSFAYRVLDHTGRIVPQEKFFPLPHLEECRIQEEEEFFSDPEGYEKGAGAGFSSCGRFGFTKGDGLLDYSMPAFGLVAKPYISGMPHYRENLLWHISILPEGEIPSGNLREKYVVPENEEIETDWTGVKWKRHLKNGKNFSLHYSLLSPEILIKTDLDTIRISHLSASGLYQKLLLPLKEGVVLHTFDKKKRYYCRKKDGPLVQNWLLFTHTGKFPEVPLQLILERSPEYIQWEEDEFGNPDSILIGFKGAVNWAFLLFPFALEVFHTAELTPDFYRKSADIAAFRGQCALQRGIKAKEYFRVEKEKVYIKQFFEYESFQDTFSTPPIRLAPLPPPLLLAKEMKMDVELDEEAFDLAFPTKYGPLYAVKGRNFSEYILPLEPHKREFVFPAKNREKLTELLNEKYDGFIRFYKEAEYTKNPGNYTFVFQFAFVLMFFHLLSGEKRMELEGLIRKGLKMICNENSIYAGPENRPCFSWYKRTEPFSSLSYLVTYLHVDGYRIHKDCRRETIEKSPVPMVENDWGNAMALYSVWLGGLLTGEWEYIGKHFEVLRKAFDYFLVLMDWACMTSSYCENGVSWNDGTNYGAYAGFLNTAEILGRKKDVLIASYAFAKMCTMRIAVMTASEKYYSKYLGGGSVLGNKFFHEETDARKAFQSCRGDITENGYRFASLYNMATEGNYTEIWKMYLRKIPDFMERILDHSKHTCCKVWEKVPEGGKVKLIQPEVFAWLWMNTYLKRYPEEELEKYMDMAMANDRLFKGFLGHPQISFRKVPENFVYVWLKNFLYGRDEVKLLAWKDVYIENASCGTFELFLTGKDPGYMIFENMENENLSFSLNGKECGGEIINPYEKKVYIHENGILNVIKKEV